MTRIAGYELDRLLGMVFQTTMDGQKFRVTRFQPGDDGGLLTFHGLANGRAQMTAREFNRGVLLRAFVEVEESWR